MSNITRELGSVSVNIKRLVKEAGLSRNKVAKMVGIAVSTFYQKVETPNLFNLRELDDVAEAIGVTVIDFLA